MKGSELVIDRFDDAKKSEECKKARQLEFDHHVIVEPLEEAFLKSLVLVAYADGKVSNAERAVIERYAAALGSDAPTLSHIFIDVASSLLSRFAGVQIWRNEVSEIGRQMGLEDDAIEQALATGDRTTPQPE